MYGCMSYKEYDITDLLVYLQHTITVYILEVSSKVKSQYMQCTYLWMNESMNDDRIKHSEHGFNNPSYRWCLVE